MLVKNHNWIASFLAMTGRKRIALLRASQLLTMTSILICFSSCSDWLDVVPQGIPTIDMAFRSRTQAIKYLGTCYSYMPRHGDPSYDPAFLGSDEIANVDQIMLGSAYSVYYDKTGDYLARGMQNAASPLFDFWTSGYQALHDCNTFIENMSNPKNVPDMLERERDQWIAEVKVLKAYYHFYLLQMYGPIPLIRKNLPIDVDVSTVKVVREPVDDCFQYIVDLLDEASEGELLPMQPKDIVGDLGRITKPIALALKAKVLVVAASPLFNGNTEQATLRNKAPDNRQLFNQTYELAKWQKAAKACKEAIEVCKMYEFHRFDNAGMTKVGDTIALQLNLREGITKRWNSGIIWANTQSLCAGGPVGGRGLQRLCMPKLNPVMTAVGSCFREFCSSVPLKIVSLFYTEHGVPLAEDKYRDREMLYNLRTATEDDKLYVKIGATIPDIHFDREPRFYAWIGFNRCIWYGHGQYDDKGTLWTLNALGVEPDGSEFHSGYFPKKYIPYTNMLVGGPTSPSYTYTDYPWPIMRLSDLYLLCAEAINEAEGPTEDMFFYIDAVRKNAGLKGVKESWSAYANAANAGKYKTKEGMRDIIRQERMIELCLEGHRFWDTRRWKIAPQVYNAVIEGWNTIGANTVEYYSSRKTIFIQSFRSRDYFWPIRTGDITNNPNLVQNIGW